MSALRVVIDRLYSRSSLAGAVRFHVPDDIPHNGLVALVFEHRSQGTGGGGGKFDRDLLRLDHDNGFVLMYLLTRILEPIADFDFGNRLANRGHYQFNGHVRNLRGESSCDQTFLFFSVTAVRTSRGTRRSSP